MKEHMRFQRKHKKEPSWYSQDEALRDSPFNLEQTAHQDHSSIANVLDSSSQALDADTLTNMEPRFRHNFSQISIHAPVLTNPGPIANTSTSTTQQENLQSEPSRIENLGQRIQAETSGGSALDDHVQTRLESGVGADLSRVHVHTDNKADQLTRSVDALAFTTGADIFFRSGAYNPGTPQGLHLLAHEATHTVQQAAGPVQGTITPDGIALSNPSDSFEREANQTANRFLFGQVDTASATQRETVQNKIGQPTTIPPIACGSIEAQTAPPAGTSTGPIPVQRQTPGDAPQTAPPPQEPDPEEIWQGIKLRATPELLIKLQEIGRAAGEQTKDQIDTLFSPYEDSLESDQTFLDVMSLGLSAAGNVPQTPGLAGLAAAGTDATKLVMRHILDFKSVGEVKKRASSDIGNMVMGTLTSSSPNYMNFETEALNEIYSEFADSWARVPPEQRTLSIAVPLYTQWFQMEARTKYGADSPAGKAVLSATSQAVATQLGPVKSKLEELKEKQKNNRMLAGALGGVVTGATIGASIGAAFGGIGAIPGAVVGGIIGGAVGLVAGALW